MISIIIALAAAQAHPSPRTYEGDWYVSDDTDNNTGQRKVYAFQTHIKTDHPDYVTLTMRCSIGKPTLFVEWHDVAFPDQSVLTIASSVSPNAEPKVERYVFEKSKDFVESGLRATPEDSAKIISDIGQAKNTTITAHLTSGAKSVEMDVSGTQRAWSRVSRHCPVRTMPVPPL